MCRRSVYLSRSEMCHRRTTVFIQLVITREPNLAATLQGCVFVGVWWKNKKPNVVCVEFPQLLWKVWAVIWWSSVSVIMCVKVQTGDLLVRVVLMKRPHILIVNPFTKRLCVCADSAVWHTKQQPRFRCIKAGSSHRCEGRPPPSAQSNTPATRNKHVHHRHEHEEQGKSQHASFHSPYTLYTAVLDQDQPKNRAVVQNWLETQS